MKAMLGELGGEFPGVLQVMETERVSARLWRGETTLWTQDPAEADEAARRLGWLLLPEAIAGHAAEFEALRSQLMSEGFRHAVVLGMGGSSLAPDVFRRMLPAARGLALHVLDSTDPEMVASLARTIPGGIFFAEGIDNRFFRIRQCPGLVITVMCVCENIAGTVIIIGVTINRQTQL